MKKYSKIIKSDWAEFRYDFDNATLQCVFIDDEKNDEILVVDEIGLSVENWLEDSAYWIEMYLEQLNQELRYM